jgi:hypothetical protein
MVRHDLTKSAIVREPGVGLGILRHLRVGDIFLFHMHTIETGF